MFILTAKIIKNTDILTGTYFIFLKESPRPNSKVFHYQIWASLKKIKKVVIKCGKF